MSPNFYGNPHKAIRAMLLDFVVEAGRADWNDAEDTARVRAIARETFAVLESHAAIENRFIAPLLDFHAPDVAAIVGAAHDDQDELLPGLALEFELFDSTAAHAAQSGHALTVKLSRFVADAFAHMADEEQLALPALRRAFTDEALLDLERQIFASVPQEKREAFLQKLLPVINDAERAEIRRMQ